MKKEKSEADKLFEEAIEALKSGKPLNGRDGALTPMIKRIVDASLEGEMESHLSDNRPNRRNGKGKKRVKTSTGEVEINTPRDHDGTFDPEFIPKRSRTLGPSLERKIISLYSAGISYSGITEHIEEIYGMSLSKA